MTVTQSPVQLYDCCTAAGSQRSSRSTGSQCRASRRGGDRCLLLWAHATGARPVAMTRFLARRAAQLPGAAGPGVVSDVQPDVADVLAAGQPDAAQPTPAAGRDRRQGRRARPGQAHPDAVRGLGCRRGARRLRHHGHRSAGLRRTVAPHRGQPAAGVDRLGAGHGHRRGGRRLGRDPAVPVSRPRHHRAVAAGAQHPDVRDRQPADPGRAAGEFGAGVQLFDYTGETSPMPSAALGHSSSTGCSTWCCRR